jgi:uncharacterized RDD family membrane protein YckC|tara:strand:- start:5682 stop:6062 length:381 start_codon:yes stop_codon:yes gene_type:complete
VPAGFLQRCYAILIDLIIFGMIISSFSLYFPLIQYMGDKVQLASNISAIYLYFILPIQLVNQTAGMFILKLKVLNHSNLPNWYFGIRFNVYWILFAVLFPLMIFSKNRQSLFDKFSCATVIRQEQK